VPNPTNGLAESDLTSFGIRSVSIGPPHAVPRGMTNDQGANRTTGETEGTAQESTDIVERDATQREQAAKEGQAPMKDPSRPDADREHP
jgi:hypothetical protein